FLGAVLRVGAVPNPVPFSGVVPRRRGAGLVRGHLRAGVRLRSRGAGNGLLGGVLLGLRGRSLSGLRAGSRGGLLRGAVRRGGGGFVLLCPYGGRLGRGAVHGVLGTRR